MSAGTLSVLAALALGSHAGLAIASVVALACGWAAARIGYTEVAQSRRAHARDRAAQARAFRALFNDRAVQHAAFVSTVTDKLAQQHREVCELEGTLRLSEVRAAAAEDRVRRESRRANDAQERVVELEAALAIRTAEEADQLASWESSPYGDMDTVVDLLAWEDRSQAAIAEQDQLRVKRA
jgi:hypothetical protein